MIKHCTFLIAAAFLLTVAVGYSLGQTAEEPAKTDQKEQKQEPAKEAPAIEISVADGNLNFSVPGTWKKKTPAINMIETEFEIPKAEGDELPGRITFMGAGGTVQANTDRWVGQFQQPDGSPVKDKKIVTMEIADYDVVVVTISGTYLDGGGRPFGEKTERENYMMVAAIIETSDDGLYFIKSYGGKKTMEANKKGFMKMIKSMTVEN